MTLAGILSTSKIKYLVMLLLATVLGFTVYQMILIEDSIREQKIVEVKVGDENKKLIPEISLAELEEISHRSKVKFIAGKKYFSILETKIKYGEKIKEWHPHYLTGVNLGVALPGKYPAEFSAAYEVYIDWFKKIADMNANTIRTYTILPPVFYEAFAQYNIDNNDKPLYLIHGVWAVETTEDNYFNEKYVSDFQKEIKDVIDVIHGNAVLEERRGHASGTYIRDVSDYTLTILLGREWEPQTVSVTNQKNKIYKFDGHFISLPHGTPMEVWLAEIMEFTIRYETQIYNKQRPVSFVNWIPLDPMYHNTEFIESKMVREYDNDLETIDMRRFYVTPLCKAGIYSAYHVYPYYPDFIYLNEKYKYSKNNNGQPDNYYGYLKDLKAHNPDMPLIIVEYGVPSSRGNSHYSPFGFHQGGHSEEEQARINKILSEDIFNTDCAGAIYFEWIDEWFKLNWLVMDFEQPYERIKLWHNLENPEQNFGLLTLENRSKVIDGLDNDWNQNEDIESFERYTVSASADASYFYLKFKLPGFSFQNNNFYVAIDTYDEEKGDHKLPFYKNELESGVEFLLSFINKDSADILVDDQYALFTDIYNDNIPVYSSKYNDNGEFVRQVLLSNRGRESLTGEKFPMVIHDRSKLVHGSSNVPEYSNSDWFWNENNQTLEIRLTWHLLNVSDPSSNMVLDDKSGTKEIEIVETDGFNVYSFITDKQDENAIQVTGMKSSTYKWDKWDDPTYTSRLKASYYMFKDINARFKVENKEEDSMVNTQAKITDWYNNKDGAVSIVLEEGSYSQYEYGLPILKKYGVKTTFGIVSDLTQENMSSSINEGSFAINKMGWNQIKEISNEGYEIASLCCNQRKDMQLENNDVLISEFKKSRIEIGKVINKKVNTVIYPYYYKDVGIETIVKESGYIFGINRERVGEDRVNKPEAANFMNLKSITSLNNSVPDLKNLFGLITDSKSNWMIINYRHIFPEDSKAVQLFNQYKIDSTYSITPEYFERHIRLFRNSNYWIAPVSEVGKYIYEKNNSRIEVQHHDNVIFLQIVGDISKSIYNHPLTIELITGWDIIKITNSLYDGIYNPRDNRILIYSKIGQEVIIENLSNNKK